MREQYERSDRIKADKDFIDYDKLDKIIIGVCGGDGIGPIITKECARVLEYMLADDVKAGRVEFRVIDGLTIENRVAANKAIPDDVLEEPKKCHVILKGPAPRRHSAGRPRGRNIESANVAMRKALDLFANMRPVKVPDQGIDWTFFRENTGGRIRRGLQGRACDGRSRHGLHRDHHGRVPSALPAWPTIMRSSNDKDQRVHSSPKPT